MTTNDLFEFNILKASEWYFALNKSEFQYFMFKGNV